MPRRPTSSRMSGVRFRWPGARSFSLSIEDFALPARERVLLVGPSGTGKSTFLSLLCGIVHAAGGHARGARHRHDAGCRRGARPLPRRALRHHLPDVQPAAVRLDPRQRAAAVELCAAAAASAPRARGRPRTEARRLLQSLGLDAASLRGLSAANLSVGQQQRVAAARALIGGAGADRRRRADLRARPRPAAGLPRSAVRRGGRGRRVAHHGQPRGAARRALRPRAAARRDRRLPSGVPPHDRSRASRCNRCATAR